MATAGNADSRGRLWKLCKIAFAREILDTWISQTTEREKQILVAGSDDMLFRKIVDAFNNRSDGGHTIFYAPVGSLNGLGLLKTGAAHLSCVHIMDLEAKEYNATYVERFLGDRNYLVVHLYLREQGIFLEKGNPKNVQALSDIAERGLRFVNRNRGSGTRLLFDFLLHQNGIEPAAIKGYDVEVTSHLESGLKVLQGSAEAAFGIKYVAHMLDLSFLPLFKERFDLVVPDDYSQNRSVRRLLAFFEQGTLISLAGDCTGYDLTKTGSIVNYRG